MKAFFYGIQDLFVNGLFAPFDALRGMHSWWGANMFNWVLMLIGCVGFVYWMLELKKYHDKGEEREEITAHTFL